MPKYNRGKCACCMPTPSFFGKFHIWLLFRFHYARNNSGMYCESYETTFCPTVPATTPFVHNPLFEFDRYSLATVSLAPDFVGGVDASSLDPSDWVAFTTDVSGISYEITPPPIGYYGFISSGSAKLQTMTVASDWTLPFTHEGKAYRMIIQNGGTLARVYFRQLSTIYDAEDYVVAEEYYALYRYPSRVRFERAN